MTLRSLAAARACPALCGRRVLSCLVATARSPLDLYRWCVNLFRVFGWKFMLTLWVVQHVLKGFAAGGGSDGLVFVGFKFALKELMVDASRLNTLFAVTTSPWAMKPILGFLSDLVPLCGYHKISWMLVASVCSVGASVTFGIVGGADFFTAEIATALIWVVCLQISLCDLLTEAKYARMLREHADHGPALMSWVWGGMYAAQLISTGITGLTLQYVRAHWCILAAAPATAACLAPLALNWLGDDRWRRGGSSDARHDGAEYVGGGGGAEGEHAESTASDFADAAVVAPATEDESGGGFMPPAVVLTAVPSGECEAEAGDGDDALAVGLVDVDIDDGGEDDGESDALHGLSAARDAARDAARVGSGAERLSLDLPPPTLPWGWNIASIERMIAIDLTKAREQKKLFALAIIMGVLSITFTGLQFAGGSSAIASALDSCESTGPDSGFLCHCTDEVVSTATALFAGAIVVVSFQLLTARTIARAQAFFFVQHMFTISVEAATLCVGGSSVRGRAWTPLCSRSPLSHTLTTDSHLTPH